MPRPSVRLPSYRLHKPTGQAVVTLAGRDHYLGRHGSPESRRKYDRLIGEYVAAGRTVAPKAREAGSGDGGVTVTQVIAAWWTSGKIPASVKHHWRTPLSVLRRMYGDSPAAGFGPLALKAVRLALVERKMARTTINVRVRHLVRMFRWAVSSELVPVAVADALATVEGIRKGEVDGMREPRKVRPVADATLERVLAAAPPVLAAMLRLQRLTGMRAGELVILRTRDVDTSGEVWAYTPERHKGTHREAERTVMIGPRAQAVLRPHLRADPAAFVFSPAAADADRRAALTAARTTPASCGNRPGTNRRRSPRRRPADRYTVGSYGRALEYACRRAFPLPDPLARRDGEKAAAWKLRLTPEQHAAVKKWQAEHRVGTHQLRHAAGTAARRVGGLDAAQAMLGHQHAATTEMYGELERGKAAEVAKQIG